MSDQRPRHHDLVVLGAGSGNFILDDSFADLDVAMVEPGPFGGTCLNRGCIPTKMLAYTAEIVGAISDAERFGIHVEPPRPDWARVRRRVFDRLDHVASSGRRGREDTSWITVYRDEARFTGPRSLHIGGAEVQADQIVIAVGGRPIVPPPVEESGLPYETSDTIMRLDAPPRRMAVLGGGYIAAELAQIFAAFGTEIVIIEQVDTLLGPQDETVAQAFTELARQRWDVRTGRSLTGVRGEPGALRIELDDGHTVEADTLLVAVGRRSNADRLDLPKAGVEVDDDGLVVVDAHQRSTADGVWALGDVSTPVPLKHVANREAEVVAHNLRHPGDLRSTDHERVPSAIFTCPQIASIGATEQQLRDDGVDHVVGRADYADAAYGWAMEDETGFCKILATPPGSARDPGRILGAHILGAQASTLIAPLVVAISLDIRADTLLNRPYWIHPALSEVVQQALVDLG